MTLYRSILTNNYFSMQKCTTFASEKTHDLSRLLVVPGQAPPEPKQPLAPPSDSVIGGNVLHAMTLHLTDGLWRGQHASEGLSPAPADDSLTGQVH